jgi:magnesium-transporting ATPase (P-type)
MRLAVAVGGVLIAAGGIVFLSLAVLSPETFQHWIRRSADPNVQLTFTGWSTAIVVLMLALQMATLLTAIWCVWRMFGEFAQEEPLTHAAALWMYRASLGFLATMVLSLLATPIDTLALTINNPPGQRAFAVSLGSTELFALLMAAVMFMTAHLLEVAADIRDDQRSIV